MIFTIAIALAVFSVGSIIITMTLIATDQVTV